MESMQGAGAGARQGARDIVVPRATCTAPSRRRKMSFFFFFLFLVSSSPSSIRAAASSSSSPIPLRRLAPGPPLGRLGSAGALQLTPAQGSTRPCRDPLQSLIPFSTGISPSHVRGSRGPRGLGFMALVNPWRALPRRSPCRFFFNAR